MCPACSQPRQIQPLSSCPERDAPVPAAISQKLLSHPCQGDEDPPHTIRCHKKSWSQTMSSVFSKGTAHPRHSWSQALPDPDWTPPRTLPLEKQTTN